MSMWKRAMDYLGLGPDDAYDDYEESMEIERPERAPRVQPPREPRVQRGHDESEGLVRVPQTGRPQFPQASPETITVRKPPAASDDSSVRIRPVARASAEPVTVSPRAFNAAQEVADRFKTGQPVIMNLEGTDKETTRRLVDFASGLCYGLNGTMEKVSAGVFLLKPAARGGHEESGHGS
jgi:cell division inhibitor SepF